MINYLPLSISSFKKKRNPSRQVISKKINNQDFDQSNMIYINLYDFYICALIFGIYKKSLFF